jgi:hypothetical protein
MRNPGRGDITAIEIPATERWEGEPIGWEKKAREREKGVLYMLTELRRLLGIGGVDFPRGKTSTRDPNRSHLSSGASYSDRGVSWGCMCLCQESCMSTFILSQSAVTEGSVQSRGIEWGVLALLHFGDLIFLTQESEFRAILCVFSISIHKSNLKTPCAEKQRVKVWSCSNQWEFLSSLESHAA